MRIKKIQCYLSIQVHYNLLYAQLYTYQLWIETSSWSA